MPRILDLQTNLFAAASDRAPIAHFTEPALTYAPPYARPVDDHFAWLLVRHLHPASELTYRPIFETPLGKLQVDFLVRRAGRRIAFLLGEDGDEPRVEVTSSSFWQSVLVTTGAADVVYSVSGRDLVARLSDALSVIAGWEPALFSADGLIGLSAASTRVSSGVAISGTGSEIRLRYGAAEDQYGDETFTWPGLDSGEVIVSRSVLPAQGITSVDERLAPVTLVA